MIRYKQMPTCLCAALVLICCVITKPVRAEDGNSHLDKPVRLYATAETGPIGTVYSPGTMTINGRVAYGAQTIWSGDLIGSSAASNARVMMDSASQVTLINGALVRLATVHAQLDDDSRGRVLIASLISGNLSVKLDQKAAAYIEARGYRLTATNGASFRVAIRDGRAEVDVASGRVEVRQQTETRRLLHVTDDPSAPGSFIVLDGQLNSEARSTRQVQFRVTDANDNPVPDLPITFTLASVGKPIGFFPGGATTFSTTTNAQGVASAPFTAGPSSASGSLTANVPGTNLTKTIEVKVRERAFWTKKKMVLIGAAAVGTIIIVDPTGPGPILQVPPVSVEPQ